MKENFKSKCSIFKKKKYIYIYVTIISVQMSGYSEAATRVE